MTPIQPPIRVLIVVDSETDRKTYGRLLARQAEPEYQITDAATGKEGLERIAAGRPDCVLLDYDLSDLDGSEFLQRLADLTPGRFIPVVVLTGGGDESIAIEAIKRGAQDYVVKGDISTPTLNHAIQGAIWRVDLQARRKRANQSLEVQNRRLGELYEMAHQLLEELSQEFRTPLTVIKEFAALIHDGFAGPVVGDQKEYLSIIADRVDDLETMVNDTLDISRLESGLLGFFRTPCCLSEIVDRVRPGLERKAAGTNVQLDVAIDSQLPRIYCDPDKVGRVVVNLAARAIKLSNEGQTVRIWADLDADASQITVGVTDEGPGIDPEDLRRIVQHLRRSESTLRVSTKGFGLGLNIARELVRYNFGDMSVRSELGKGSTFSFTIPAAEVGKFMPHYLTHVQQCRSDNAYISLVGISAQDTEKDEALDDVEPFLQHQIRRTDLIFPSGDRRWLLVVPTTTRDLGNLLQRILKAREEANRNRPSGQLPAFTLHVEGTWRMDEQVEEFLSVFSEALRADQRVGV